MEIDSINASTGDTVELLTGINFSGTGLGGPDGQDSRSCSDIHDNLVLETVSICHNSRVVGSHSVVISEHLLLMVQLCVGTKVVGKIRRLGLGISVERRNLIIARSVGERWWVGVRGRHGGQWYRYFRFWKTAASGCDGRREEKENTRLHFYQKMSITYLLVAGRGEGPWWCDEQTPERAKERKKEGRKEGRRGEAKGGDARQQTDTQKTRLNNELSTAIGSGLESTIFLLHQKHLLIVSISRPENDHRKTRVYLITYICAMLYQSVLVAGRYCVL